VSTPLVKSTSDSFRGQEPNLDWHKESQTLACAVMERVLDLVQIDGGHIHGL